MATTASRITVTAAATLLHAASSAGARLTIANRDAANPVSLGPAGVTFASGYELKINEIVALTIPAGDELYAIAGAALTARLDVLKTGG